VAAGGPTVRRGLRAAQAKAPGQITGLAALRWRRNAGMFYNIPAFGSGGRDAGQTKLDAPGGITRSVHIRSPERT
jgi:hypothetical protein